MAGYIIIVSLGILFGGLVNMYTHFSERRKPLFKWCIGLLYRRANFSITVLVQVLVYIFLYEKYGLTLEFAGYGLLSSLLLAASVVDIKSRIIPNKLVVAGFVSGFAVALLHLRIPAVIDSLFGVLIAAFSLGIIYLFSKGGVGIGDVKLFACTGAFLGPGFTLYALILSTLMSGLTGAIMLIIRISNRKSEIPFAPFIFLGSLLTVLYF